MRHTVKLELDLDDAEVLRDMVGWQMVKCPYGSPEARVAAYVFMQVSLSKAFAKKAKADEALVDGTRRG